MACPKCWDILQNMFMLCISCIGLFVYVIVILVLIKYSKTTFKRPFFTFCISLGLVEIVGLMKPILDSTINEYMQKNVDDRIFQRVLGGLGRVPWYAILFHQVYMALERVTALLYPKIHDKMWTTRMMCCHYTVIAILSLATNLCITTEYCPYVLYDDGVTNFYNMSIRGALLHNQIIDLGIQPFIILIITIMYIVAGVKIIKIRKQIKGVTRNDGTSRKRRMEIMLVLQGFLVSAPQISTALVHHIIIYVALPDTIKLMMIFFRNLFSRFVYSFSPFLYLALNMDIRMKLAEMLVGKQATVNVASNQPAAFTITPTTTIRRRQNVGIEGDVY